MAFKNQEGKLISYSSSEMLKEALLTFAQIGDVDVIAIMTLHHGVRLITDWIFAEDKDHPDVKADPTDYETDEPMKLSEMISFLQKQDEPVEEFEYPLK